MNSVLGFVEGVRSRVDAVQVLAAQPDQRMVQLAVGDLIEAQDKAAGAQLFLPLLSFIFFAPAVVRVSFSSSASVWWPSPCCSCRVA